MPLHVSICDAPSCRISVDGKLEQCPKCGGPVRHVRQSQPRGCVLLVIGLILVLMMASVCYYTVPMMLRPGEETGGSTFEGSPVQALVVLALFALVMGFGLAAAVGGLYEILTGRQHPFFLRAIFLIFTALMVAAVIVPAVIG